MSPRDIPFPTHCARCGARLRDHTMSTFNTDTICSACAADERLAPGFRAARDAEEQACRGGDYNFPGVGLSAEDRAFLQMKRGTR
jgi:hypothetical protein